MEPGTPVVFTAGRLGTLNDKDDFRFEDRIVKEGDEGVYVGPHPSSHLDGWHLCTVDDEGRTLFVPVMPEQFRVATAVS